MESLQEAGTPVMGGSAYNVTNSGREPRMFAQREDHTRDNALSKSGTFPHTWPWINIQLLLQSKLTIAAPLQLLPQPDVEIEDARGPKCFPVLCHAERGKRKRKMPETLGYWSIHDSSQMASRPALVITPPNRSPFT